MQSVGSILDFFSLGLLTPTRVSGCLRMTENSVGE